MVRPVRSQRASATRSPWLLLFLVVGLSLLAHPVLGSTVPFSFRAAFSRRRRKSSQRNHNHNSHKPFVSHDTVSIGGATKASRRSSNAPLVSLEDKLAFTEDGYLVIRGLFTKQEVDEMTAAADALVHLAQEGQDPKSFTFSVIEKNLIYGGGTPMLGTGRKPLRDDEKALRQEILQTFRNVALRSKLPQICAELMNLDPEAQCLHLLRDVFLGKEVSDAPTCDWHVDDQAFWPESFLTTAEGNDSQDLNGINVWLALDDYTPQHGGSMILSRGSHKTEWRHEAYESIGQDRAVDGAMDKEELFEKMIGSLGLKPNGDDEEEKKPIQGIGTCTLNTSNPDVRAKAEAGRVELHLNKGDCILATRLLFHRTSQVTPKGLKHYASQGKNLLHRYSLRYVPGTARLPSGFAHTMFADTSVQCHPQYAGQSLKNISRKSPAWYPKTWPVVDANIDEKLDRLASRECARAQINAQANREEFVRLVEQVRQEQRDDPSQKSTTP